MSRSLYFITIELSSLSEVRYYRQPVLIIEKNNISYLKKSCTKPRYCNTVMAEYG